MKGYTMMTAQTASRKYLPHVRIVDASQGLYTVQSERYTYVLYLVTVHANGATSCECEAGRRARSCKHQKIVRAYVAYRARPQHIRPAVVALAA